MLLITLFLAFLATIGLGAIGASNEDAVVKVICLFLIYILGRGAPDLTMMTSRSWGGFWGWVTSPLMAGSLLLVGFVTTEQYYFGAAIAHLLGWITIRLIWRLFFLRK